MRGAKRFAVGGGAFVLCAALLAACSAAPGSVPTTPGALVASHAPSPAQTPSPTMSATPTPPVPTSVPTPTIDPADVSSWTIDFDGVGPARLGVQLAVDRASLTQLTDESQPTCPIGVFSSDAAPTIILVPDASSTVTAIEVSGLLWGHVSQDFHRTPRTHAGIGADSTLADVLAAYPGIQKTGRYSFIDYYGISNGEGRWIVFAVDADTGAVWGIQTGSTPGMPKELCG